MLFEVIPVKGLVENAYLLKGPRIALVDTLSPNSWSRLLEALSSNRLSVGDVECVLVTHCHFDHVGNLARVVDLSGARVMAGAADAAVIEGRRPNPPASDINRLGRCLRRLPDSLLAAYQKCEPAEVDVELSEGDLIEELGLRVIEVPGHTAGGVAFHEAEGGLAFTGDLVSNYFSRPGMPVLSASESIRGILESQEKLARLGLGVAYPGHGRPIGPDASGVIGELARRKKADFDL